MLEGLVAWVLNNYLGKYVENLNTDQLSIALLSGEVELENLPIRKDALHILGLPMQVRAGYIGRIRLQIPVRQFRSAPWVILIEQLNIVSGPVNLDEWDADFERATAFEFKLNKLDNHESKWRALRDSSGKQSYAPGYYASSYSSWLSYGASFVSGIVDNLQFKIHDVHIRYEDNISIPGQIFACGLTLGSLTTQFSPNSTAINGSSKTMELQALSFYWDTIEDTELLGSLSLGELAIALNGINQTHEFILQPVKGQALLVRDYEETSVKPRLVCDLQLNLVPLTLVDWQYDQMIKCIQGLDTIAKIRKNRENRPLVSVRENRKAWWLYALLCHGHDFYNRPSWEDSLIRARDNVQYVELYMKLLLVPSCALSPEQKQLKARMEMNLNIDELKVLREISMNRVPKPTKPSEESGKGYGVLFQWFPQYWGWYSSAGGDHTPQLAVKNEMTNTLETEILDALANVKEENHSCIMSQINFTLEQGTFIICMGESYKKSVPMLELHFQSVKASVEARSRTGSYQAKLALGSLSILDKISKNTIFPVLVCPQGKDDAPLPRMRHWNQRPRVSVNSQQSSGDEPLFSLSFERKPLGQNADYLLSIKSRALDIVYNVNAVHWLVEFICKPHQTASTRRRINDMKLRTKQKLLKNWEHLLEGDLSERKIWWLELDISAPQIIFVESFLDCDTNIAVLDFGRLVLSNKQLNDDSDKKSDSQSQFLHRDSEDEDMFMTPCSTPPGSEASGSDSPTLCSALGDAVTCKDTLQQSLLNSINQLSLHKHIYDKYNIELSDLQILVGRTTDNWGFAHSRGSSTLHILDRFNISLQVERRLVHTADPQYPSLIVSGTLPRLVMHVAEQKIISLKKLLDILESSEHMDSPFRSPTNVDSIPIIDESVEESVRNIDQGKDSTSKVITLQFSIEQLAIEVQSRGRSVAELQVSGVRLGFTKSFTETSATLLVHGLLLVDALQTFGPDFELLMASHKHVGMDSVSGSLRDSDPCSPNSPASPDPAHVAGRATSPHQISRALDNLRQGYATSIVESHTLHKSDSEALIVIELLHAHALENEEALRVASIQFNNLDIIANQETIVELIGFANRLLPKFSKSKDTVDSLHSLYPMDSVNGIADSAIKTEITFDFHRLNVLVLRALMRDGCYIGRKVATATMSEARIHATVCSKITVEGSLGGLQVLDLTPTGITHQRVLSVGKDPLTDPDIVSQTNLLQILTTEIYNASTSDQMVNETKNQEALSFHVIRDTGDSTDLEIKLRMGSVWYTYSPHLLIELKMCVTEFQTYLSQLAKSIKARAAGMAKGLVQVRMDSFSQDSYSVAYCSKSLHGEGSPSPPKLTQNVTVKLDVVLDTPVLVLPRCPTSPQVFVAHLGKISLSNTASCMNEDMTRQINKAAFDTYIIEVRDMNLYSLDTTERRNLMDTGNILRAEKLYSSEDGSPILHNTTVRLEIAREILDCSNSMEHLDDNDRNGRDCVQLLGSVVTPLRVSLSREQYEQLLDTVDHISSSAKDFSNTNDNDANIKSSIQKDSNINGSLLDIKVKFEVPCLTLELRGDCGTGQQGLVEISLRDFLLNYEKCHDYMSNLLVSLRTLVMEDLLKEPDSKYRYMVLSSSEKQRWSYGGFVSRSCPNLIRIAPSSVESSRGSLPDHLETGTIFNPMVNQRQPLNACPGTPPSSPSQIHNDYNVDTSYRPSDALVRVSALLINEDAPEFDTKYKSLHKTVSVDFNSLDMVVAVQSWLVVLDFFGMSDDNRSNVTEAVVQLSDDSDNTVIKKSEVEIFIRSLNMIMIRKEEDLAKVTVSNVAFVISRDECVKVMSGSLGSLSLVDLTSHGLIYRERFATAGKEALNFVYTTNMARNESAANNSQVTNINANLHIKMSSVRYVHTKRFLTEIQYFFKHLSLLQTVMDRAKQKSKNKITEWNRVTGHLLLDIRAKSPVILFPVSSTSEYFLVADVGELIVRNKFLYAGHQETISVQRDSLGPIELLDVMSLDLIDTDLFTGMRDDGSKQHDLNKGVSMDLVGFMMLRLSPSLLTEKCHLQIQLERNLNYASSHNVSDLTTQCILSKLDATLDLDQYKLIRGMLKFNLGEVMEDVTIPVDIHDVIEDNSKNAGEIQIWTMNCLQILLHDVSVDLSLKAGQPLACINFIKSRLTVETYSDNTQDIDLISQEILVADTRYRDEPANKRCNVFSNILQPIHFNHDNDQVQAEVHSRIRRNNSKFTILLNNMRLMAIFDWLELTRNYLQQCQTSPDEQENPTTHKYSSGTAMMTKDNYIFELKLNITDSELVVIENASQWDTNAVILKSTSVISYKPETPRPLSLNLNQLELFSCILGMEDDSALSIIDPVTIQIDLNSEGLIEAQLHTLSIRLSYHDVRMFTQIFHSLPQQFLGSVSIKNKPSPPANSKNQISKLAALGFSKQDCSRALEHCNHQLDEAALWLTKISEPLKYNNTEVAESIVSIFKVNIVEVKANCISICIIDDCRDSDVPLVEFSLSQLLFHYDLRTYKQHGDNEVTKAIPKPILPLAVSEASTSGGCSQGLIFCDNNKSDSFDSHVLAILASDYYNRALSGWEPFIEPWKCEITIQFGRSSNITNDELHVKILSSDMLNVSVTSTLIDLINMVHKNWTQDIYNGGNDTGQILRANTPPGFKRRYPFVPFALRNETGAKLWFHTMITTPDSHSNKGVPDAQDANWTCSLPDQTMPFSFSTGPSRRRHQDTHKLSLHQLFVRVEGWQTIGPVSIDKVGVYFRQANADNGTMMTIRNIEYPRARIVFAVSLEGSAQKLVTIRSALRLINQIGTSIQLKMEYFNGQFGILKWPAAKETIVEPGSCYSIPLSHAHSHIKIRPVIGLDKKRSASNLMLKNWTKNSSSVDENRDRTNHANVSGTAKLDSTVREAIKVLGNRTSLVIKQQDKQSVSDFQYCRQPIIWWQVQRNGDVVQELRTCYEKDKPYRFVACVKRENYPVNLGSSRVQPAHTITILPTVQLQNRLPYDLLYKCIGCTQSGRVIPNGRASLTEIDLEKSTEISITLDSFPGAGVIQMTNGITGNMTQRLRMMDSSNRPLYLEATISVSKDAGLQVSVWCPYWLLNRTGLPILFRQEGAAQDAAGQGPEHEAARMIGPLLFSFADSEASPALIMRRGKYYDGGVPQWCQALHLQTGIQVRRLITSLPGGRTEAVALVGVEVRPGRGSDPTTLVTITPRYQIYNHSARRLQFSQKCFATTVSDPGAQATHQESMVGCHQPFHWPRLDKEQLLCVRILDIEGCLWSNGIQIDHNYSQHINIRDCSGGMHFLRMEVLLQGATFFIIIGDAQELPPPIRIDNYSQVPITFYQSCCKDQFHTVARPGTAVAYALDESRAPALISLGAPGGITCAYDIYDLGPAKGLTYENFIYIAFSGTFKNNHDITPPSGLDVDDQRLVLGVPQGDRVILVPKQTGNRSQLWRMTSSGQLQHEGSSPPREPDRKRAGHDKILVLDIEGPAPQPSQYVKLVLRRPDPRRRSTQTWRFTDDGRLTCAHNNMCVQAKDGFFGVRPGNEAVLGLPQLISHRFTNNGIPLEQAVSRQRLRPGSGFLSVVVTTDGPTRVLQIHDIKIPGSYPLPCDWRSSNVTATIAEASSGALVDLQQQRSRNRELRVSIRLDDGLGLSLVSRIPADELMYISLAGIVVHMYVSKAVQNLDLKVNDVQIDNQLLDAPCTVLLHSRTNRSDITESQAIPAIHITSEVLPSPNLNAVIFKHLIVTLRPLSVFLEERLLLRMAAFMGLGAPADGTSSLNDADFEAQKIATQVTASNAKRYYFGVLQIIPGQIRLSMMTTSKLPPHLQAIKRHLGLTLIKFEDAAIELEAFSRRHPFETSQSLMQSIIKHYKDELKWQAANILGSVDFLGNPLGFVNDVSEGVSGLFSEGNVAALVKNVTHGLSNSAAKVTESLSDGLGRVIMDEQHEETRQRIRSAPGSSSHHLLTGLKGLGFGLLGGVTSIVKQTYEGAANEGVQGLFSGLGKGLVGTVTKPIVGVLDLASETATAVRDSSRSSSRILPERRRLPRCVTSSLGGLLPPYSHRHAIGQQFMFQLNGYDYTEIFMGYESIRTGGEDLRVLISSEWIRVFTRTPERSNVVVEVHMSDLVGCKHVSTSENNRMLHYIEIKVTLNTGQIPLTSLHGSNVAIKRPRVRCDNEAIALSVSRQINYAKSIYAERLQTLILDVT